MDSDSNFSQDFLNLIKVHAEFERVKEFLEGSLLYHTADKSGATLLHYSAQYNNKNLTKYLLDKSCDVNIQDLKGTTPLMLAVTENHEAVMKILLSAGADVFKLNNEKKSSLHMMNELSRGQRSIIQLLLQELQRKFSTSEEIAEKLIGIGCPLYLVALLKDAEITECMIRQGSPVDEAHPTSKCTGLHVAVRLDDLKSVHVLLKYGADVNALDFNNANSLFNVYRIYPEHNVEKIEILKVLMNHGASMTSCLFNSLFNASYVLTRGNREVIRILIESVLDFDAKDNSADKNVLHYLSSNSNPAVAKELKLHGQKFNLNITDNIGHTALADAVAKANVHMVEFLLKKGSKTDTKHSIHGTTPFFSAYGYLTTGFRSQYRQCGEMLLQYNADPQFLARDSSKTLTILDSALEKEGFNQIKPVIAHLAILEQLGTPIIEIISAKINAHEPLKEHFDNCRRFLKEQISERVTLFHLITSDKKKMARYLNDKNTDRKLMDGSYRSKMLSSHRYYYNILGRRYVEGMRYKKLKNKAAIVICKFFQNRVHKTHIVIDKIIDYLNHRSLRRLSLLYYQLSLHHRGDSVSTYNLLRS